MTLIITMADHISGYKIKQIVNDDVSGISSITSDVFDDLDKVIDSERSLALNSGLKILAVNQMKRHAYTDDANAIIMTRFISDIVKNAETMEVHGIAVKIKKDHKKNNNKCDMSDDPSLNLDTGSTKGSTKKSNNKLSEDTPPLIDMREYNENQIAKKAMLGGSNTKKHHENNSFFNALKHVKKRSEQGIKALEKPRYANGQISRIDLMHPVINNGKWTPNYRSSALVRKYNCDIARAYNNCRDDFKDDPKFIITKKKLIYKPTNTTFIINIKNNRKRINKLKNTKKFKDYKDNIEDSNNILSKYWVTDDFLRYLIKLDNWKNVANGVFNDDMENILIQNHDSGIPSSDLSHF